MVVVNVIFLILFYGTSKVARLKQFMNKQKQIQMREKEQYVWKATRKKTDDDRAEKFLQKNKHIKCATNSNVVVNIFPCSILIKYV